MACEVEFVSPSFSSKEESDFCVENLSPKDLGIGTFGCSHYRRRCRIRAPCCGEIFCCRHCHNEVKNSLETNPVDRHVLPRREIKKVICSLCDTEQDVQQHCISCGVCMGKYFCAMCNFFDDDISKHHYHCDECGLCRTGGKENFFHCHNCGCCYSKEMEDRHRCVERAMHHDCPVCFEFLFESTKTVSVLPCGHTIHFECLKEMERHHRYSCPVCSKSICDMSELWKKLDEVIASTPVPEAYQGKKVCILCNDCGAKCEVAFHIMARKCVNCKSYNTRQTQGAPTTTTTASYSANVAEMVR